MNPSINISVIVAVYQAEKYIRHCLDCLRRQTLKNFEVLLIDDGSKDKSGDICDEYADMDCRFRVFHKENGGVATARQMGLNNARGDFIIHVDPDDWCEPTMLDELLNIALKDNADVVICDYFMENKNQQKYYKQKPTNLDNKSFFIDLINGKLHGSCWNKLIRINCFRLYGIEFQSDVIFCEDLFVNLKLAEHAIKISYLPKAFYHYYQVDNYESAIHQQTVKRLKSLQTIIKWLEQKKEPAIKNGIIEMKKNVKWTAFFIKEIQEYDFKTLYSEVNTMFHISLKSFGHWDFFVAIALRFSLRFSRVLFKVKVFATELARR